MQSTTLRAEIRMDVVRANIWVVRCLNCLNRDPRWGVGMPMAPSMRSGKHLGRVCSGHR